MRIGQGYDVHAIIEGNSIWLGGVNVEAGFSLKGHSDADVLLHAIADALFGAIADHDIGFHFADTDIENKNRPSREFVSFALKKILQSNLIIKNLDCTIIAEKPKISPIRTQIRESIAELLHTDIDNISVKATTTEKLGFTGRQEGIAAMAIVLLEEKQIDT